MNVEFVWSQNQTVPLLYDTDSLTTLKKNMDSYLNLSQQTSFGVIKTVKFTDLFNV